MMKFARILTAFFLLQLVLTLFVFKSTAQAATFHAFSDYNKNFTIEGNSPMSKSSSPDWWVNSGGTLTITNGIGKTMQGEANSSNRWYKPYSRNADAEYGKRPQNIFRLVTRTTWTNFSQEGFFKINKYNLTNTSNRTETNGFFLFNRYAIDGQTLYYTGLRVDGTVSIKKKYNGTYYTMKSVKVLSGTYNRNSSPNLIPIGQWHGLKSVVTNEGNRVAITVYTDINRSGKWKEIAKVYDDGSNFKTPIIQNGYAGIRTDFMDAEFKDYKITSL